MKLKFWVCLPQFIAPSVFHNSLLQKCRLTIETCSFWAKFNLNQLLLNNWLSLFLDGVKMLFCTEKLLSHPAVCTAKVNPSCASVTRFGKSLAWQVTMRLSHAVPGVLLSQNSFLEQLPLFKSLIQSIKWWCGFLPHGIMRYSEGWMSLHSR